MCLAIPVRIIETDENDTALVELNGLRTRINTSLVENIEVGDFVILHVGYALSKLDPEEAEATLQLMSSDVHVGDQGDV